MALLLPQAWLWVLLVRRQVGGGPLRLVLGVTVWWLLIVGAIRFAVPAPEIVRTPSVPTFTAGYVGYVHVPSGATWLIPVDRATYYEYDRALLDDDEGGSLRALARPGWVVVIHGQAARVVDIDHAAVQVELLESPNTGGRGWLPAERLRPYIGGP